MEIKKDSRYSSYPSTRDSGLPWLGHIPAHWEVKRLKHVANVMFSSVDKHTVEGERPVYLCNYVDVYKNERITSDFEFMRASASAEEIRKFTLKKDDVMITKDSESWNDIAIPAYVPTDLENVLCGYHLALLRPKSAVDGKFLFRALQARPINYQFEVEATGITRYGIDQYAIGNTYFLLPPLSEQRTITAFLDHQTAKIDALITKKQRLLDLLAEQRVALISQAVTKGLPPSPSRRGAGGEVRMKDSGVVWLGQVPGHWDVKRMKYISTEALQYGANESAEIDDPSLPRFVRITDIREDGTLRDETFKSLPEEVAEPFLLKYGDILFARSGATVGKSFMYRKHWGKACYAGYLIRVRVNPKLAKPEFISYFANSSLYWDWISSIFIQATIQNVSAEKYGNMLLPIPTLSEQEKIVEYLDYQTKRLTNMATKVETAIERLREYRSALISSAVTGKIKVEG